MLGSRKSMRTVTLGIGAGCPSRWERDGVMQVGIRAPATPLIAITRKWIWWMWKACASPVWLSMVQSSTAPILVVISGRIRRM